MDISIRLSREASLQTAATCGARRSRRTSFSYLIVEYYQRMVMGSPDAFVLPP